MQICFPCFCNLPFYRTNDPWTAYQDQMLKIEQDRNMPGTRPCILVFTSKYLVSYGCSSLGCPKLAGWWMLISPVIWQFFRWPIPIWRFRWQQLSPGAPDRPDEIRRLAMSSNMAWWKIMAIPIYMDPNGGLWMVWYKPQMNHYTGFEPKTS